MITVTVNGKGLNADVSSMRSLGDLVEFVKATIDPDTIITSMKFDGRDLSDADWHMPLTAQGAKELDIATGSRATYLSDRLSSAVFYLDNILKTFAETTEALKKGDVKAGNTALQKGVQDMNAFLSWYATLMQLLPPERQEPAKKFQESIKSFNSTCEQMLQQQLYRAWWAVAETIETKLTPQLTSLKGDAVMLFSQQK